MGRYGLTWADAGWHAGLMAGAVPMPVPGMQAGRSDLGHGVMTDRMVVDQRQWEREQMMQVGLVCA